LDGFHVTDTSTASDSDQARLRNTEALLANLHASATAGQPFEQRLLGWPAVAIERHLVTRLSGLSPELTIVGRLIAPSLARHVYQTQKVFTPETVLSTLQQDPSVLGLLPVAASVAGLEVDAAVQKVVHHWAHADNTASSSVEVGKPQIKTAETTLKIGHKIALTVLGLGLGFSASIALIWTQPRITQSPPREPSIDQQEAPSSIPHPDQIPDFIRKNPESN